MADDLALLQETVALLDGAGEPRERARAHFDLGVALRRAGRAIEAREPLRLAVDLAHRSGARELEDRALAELRATGAKPRRRLTSGAGALTPSERRIAVLAADGRLNREIAQMLFVTIATVEFHLGNAYRKLGIRSRAQLSAALGPERERALRVIYGRWGSPSEAMSRTARLGNGRSRARTADLLLVRQAL
jgi:DNA-binding CsgD family transcriptional regulator